MPESSAEVVVVGAGPGGLAAAAALAREGVRAVVLERADCVGASWRTHYDRLHLHTVRWLSGLPGLPIPRREGRWVSREGFVRYLDQYAEHHRLDVRTGTEITRLSRRGTSWRIETTRGDWTAAGVVIATGYNRVPHLPAWPGRDGFRGELLHSSAYRSGAAFAGRDVLVVGAGNSGAEIAVDLVEHGAARVRVSIRTPPNIVRRTVAGLVPTQLVSIALRRLPLPVSDALARATARLTVGDLSRFGLPRPGRGIYTQMIRDRQIPIIDVGFIAALRTRRLEIVPAVEGFEGAAVVLRGGGRIAPDAVIAATGFRAGLDGLLGELGILAADGSPSVHGARTSPHAPDLHLLGFTNPPTGNLRELGLDARRVARVLRRSLASRTREGAPASPAAVVPRDARPSR
ncbi:MAG TPA: NAD(P)/FAD-dependent oxidoreductase [Anaeromyxobacter sp.]|nr:NAD(P)/FAD-dependent oxidoreductase [Anaeromyxobacter sp.]